VDLAHFAAAHGFTHVSAYSGSACAASHVSSWNRFPPPRSPPATHAVASVASNLWQHSAPPLPTPYDTQHPAAGVVVVVATGVAIYRIGQAQTRRRLSDELSRQEEVP